MSSSVAPRKTHVLKSHGRLFRKYVTLFVAVVCVALITNGLFEIWMFYREHKASLIRIQREQAEAAATKIHHFISDIEAQLGWTTQLPWTESTLEQRRINSLRLLRLAPAVAELAQIDPSGPRAAARFATDHGHTRTARSTSPRIRNSSRRWPTSATTARSISATSPSRI